MNSKKMNRKVWFNGQIERPIGDFEFEYGLEMKSEYRFDIGRNANWASLINRNYTGIWRYEPMLAVSTEAVSKYSSFLDAELADPIEIPELADKLKVHKFYIIPCLYGKAGNFKDYEASFVIGKLKEWNYNGPISFHSTGNTARAYHEYAISAGIKSAAFLPLSCVNKLIGTTNCNDNQIFLYNGPFQELSPFAKKWAKENGYLHITPLRWKVEGKIPLGYHIYETLPQTTHIVQTIAGGYGVIGLHEAYSRLMQWNIAKTFPAFDLFQIESSDTFATIYPFAENEISKKDIKVVSNSLEPTLQSTNPLSTYGYIRDICLDTKSRINSVKYHEIIQYAPEFMSICNKYGIPISFIDEKSPFISYAGMRILSEQNMYDKNDIITFIITGSKVRTGALPFNMSIINPELK